MLQAFEKPSFIELSRHVRERYAVNKDRIFPKGSEIFRAFDLSLLFGFFSFRSKKLKCLEKLFLLTNKGAMALLFL